MRDPVNAVVLEGKVIRHITDIPSSTGKPRSLLLLEQRPLPEGERAETFSVLCDRAQLAAALREGGSMFVVGTLHQWTFAGKRILIVDAELLEPARRSLTPRPDALPVSDSAPGTGAKESV